MNIEIKQKPKGEAHCTEGKKGREKERGYCKHIYI